MDQLSALDPDVSVVASYGHLLTDAVIARPSLGTVNVHASLLPALRGAAPIRAAIRDGHEVTGVTVMRMVRELDAGPIIHQVPAPIAPDETYGELHLRLSELGALALIEALTLLELGKADERPQDESAVTYASKINRESSRIDWSGSCMAVARHIRAFDPTPGSLTTLKKQDVKLFGASAVESGGDATADPGTVLAIGEDGMRVACGAGAVSVSHAQPAGKRRMRILDWRRGRGIAVADRFGA
jgi:methionyl-tRNA formyltransferase